MTDLIALAEKHGTPLYVYDGQELDTACRALTKAFSPLDAKILFAAKANSHPAILRRVYSHGLGVDAVSLGEVQMAFHAGLTADSISFNGNNVGSDEMRAVHALGVEIIVDSLAQLQRFGELFPGEPVGIRYNPPEGEGHHRHVITGGPESKFGIDTEDLATAREIAGRHKVRIEGVQQHVGSGILQPDPLLLAADRLLAVADDFPDLRWLDFGGGFGIPYRNAETALDLEEFATELAARLARFRAATGRESLGVRFEPGRFVAATCGKLIIQATAVKTRGGVQIVGTDSGFNHLLRPALYDSFHEIINLSCPDAPVTPTTVAGNICESGDLFARNRLLPTIKEGDLLALHDTGAYGMTMASSYNLRGRPAEILVDGQDAWLIRHRERFDDLLRGVVEEPA